MNLSSLASALFVFAFLLAIVGSPIGAVIAGTLALAWEAFLFVFSATEIGGPAE